MKPNEDIIRAQVRPSQEANLFAATACSGVDVAKEMEGTSIQKGRLVFQLPAVQSDKANFTDFCWCRCGGVCVCTIPTC